MHFVAFTNTIFFYKINIIIFHIGVINGQPHLLAPYQCLYQIFVPNLTNIYSIHNGVLVFHTGLAQGLAQIQSRAWAEPLVWTFCRSAQEFQLQAYTELNLVHTEGSAQNFLSCALNRASGQSCVCSFGLLVSHREVFGVKQAEGLCILLASCEGFVRWPNLRYKHH